MHSTLLLPGHAAAMQLQVWHQGHLTLGTGPFYRGQMLAACADTRESENMTRIWETMVRNEDLATTHHYICYPGVGELSENGSIGQGCQLLGYDVRRDL